MQKTRLSIQEKIRDGLITRLKTHFFTQVVNTSGAPITTIVDDFVIPSLQSNSITGMAGNKWNIVKIKPGLNPLESLITELTKIGNIFSKGTTELGDLNRLRNLVLKSGSNGLIQFIKETTKLKGAPFNLLIVLEDFESLLLYNQFYQNNRLKGIDIDFMSLLLSAIMDTECPLYLLTGLYPKYANLTIKYLGYPELVHKGRYTLPMLNIGHIEEATSTLNPNATFEQILKNTFTNDKTITYWQLFLVKQVAYLQSKRPHVLKNLNITKSNLTQLVALYTKDYLQQLSSEEYTVFKKSYQQLISKHPAIDAYQPISLHSLALRVFGESATNKEEQIILQLLEAFNTNNFPFFNIDDSTSIHTKTSSDLIIRLANEVSLQPIQAFNTWENEERINQATYERVLKQTLDYQKARADSLLLSGYELENTLEWKDNAQPNAYWILGFTQQNGLLSPLIEIEKANIYTISDFLKKSKLKEQLEKEKTIAELEKKKKRTIRIMLTFLVLGFLATMLAIWAYFAKIKAEQISSNLSYFSLLEKLNAENRFDRGTYLDIRNEVLNPNSSNESVKESLKNKIGENALQVSKIIDFQLDLINTTVLRDSILYYEAIKPLFNKINAFHQKNKDSTRFEASLFYSLCKDVLEDIEIRNDKKNGRYLRNLDGLLGIAVHPKIEKKYLLLTRYKDIIKYKTTEKGIKKPTLLLKEEVDGLTNITYSSTGIYLFGVTDNGKIIKWEEKGDTLIQKDNTSIRSAPHLSYVHETAFDDVVIAVSDNSFYIVQSAFEPKVYKGTKYNSFEHVQVNSQNNLVVVSSKNQSFIYQLEKNNEGRINAKKTSTILHQGETAYIGAINKEKLITLALTNGLVYVTPYNKGNKDYDILNEKAFHFDNSFHKKSLTYTLDFWNYDTNKSFLAIGYVSGIVSLYTLFNDNGTYKTEQFELRGNKGPVFEVAFNNEAELLTMDEWNLVFYPSSIQQCLDEIEKQLKNN